MPNDAFALLLSHYMRRIRASASGVAAEIGLSRESVNNRRNGSSLPSPKSRDRLHACARYLRLTERETYELFAAAGLEPEFPLQGDAGSEGEAPFADFIAQLFMQLAQSTPYPVTLLLSQAHVLLVFVANTAQAPMPALQAWCEDRANLAVMIDGAAQTECLLTRRPADVLLRVLAAQLRVTRISPYQTRGAINSADAFFGREQLLARVIGREPANYLVVGGRQLGKSSLLKAVQRRLQDHPQIVSHYLSPRDDRLAPRLALQFGLAAGTALDDIIHHLETTYSGKCLFLLIDEADLFFRNESCSGCQQLAALRALSDEGHCWFMLAGFWDLYATAVLDYQSPLRNFGEVLTIGALETEACRELASAPLARLQLEFVLRRCEGEFEFAVPLFRKQFEAGETAVLLRQELAAQRTDHATVKIATQ